LLTIVSFVSGQYIDENLCVFTDNGLNIQCPLGQYIPLNEVPKYSSHGMFYNRCLVSRSVQEFLPGGPVPFCYSLTNYRPCNDTIVTGDAMFCLSNTCNLSAQCFCRYGSLETTDECKIGETWQTMNLDSTNIGGILINSHQNIMLTQVQSFDPEFSYIKAKSGFIARFQYPYKIFLRTPTYTEVIKAPSGQLNYRFKNQMEFSNFEYSLSAFDMSDKLIGVVTDNHTALNFCLNVTCVICSQAFEHFDCLDEWEQFELVMVTILISLLLLGILSLFLYILYKATCFFLPKSKYLMSKISNMEATHQLNNKLSQVKNCFLSCFRQRRVRGNVNLSLITVLGLIGLAICCNDGGTFTGEVTNCSGSTCSVRFSISSVIDSIGQALCLSVVQDTFTILTAELRVTDIFNDLTYLIQYYTGDHIDRTASKNNCYEAHGCPDNCNDTYSEPTLNGIDTDPVTALMKGYGRCFRTHIDGPCFFFNNPGCQYCSVGFQPTGQPHKVLEYQSPSPTKATVHYKAFTANTEQEGDFLLVNGIPTTLCIDTVCVRISMELSLPYIEDPDLQYLVYPLGDFGSTAKFSLPSEPTKLKYGDIQSQSPSPWESSSYWREILYAPGLVTFSPTTNNICGSQSYASPFSILGNYLPRLVHLKYVEIVEENNDFSFLRVHSINSTSTLITIQALDNSTITRNFQTCLFSASDFVINGCCDCPTGATITFNVDMPSGCLGYIDVPHFDFSDPSLLPGSNSHNFWTDRCSGTADVSLTTDSMSYTYEVDYTLNNVPIHLISSLLYTTLEADTSVFDDKGNKNSFAEWFKDVLSFKNGMTMAGATGVIIYSCVAIVILLCCCGVGIKLIKIALNKKTV